MSMEAQIRTRLAQLQPASVEIADDSAAHAGHAGAASGGGHYTVAIVSDFDTGRLELRQPCADLRLNAHAIGKSYLPSGAGASCGMWR